MAEWLLPMRVRPWVYSDRSSPGQASAKLVATWRREPPLRKTKWLVREAGTTLLIRYKTSLPTRIDNQIGFWWVGSGKLAYVVCSEKKHDYIERKTQCLEKHQSIALVWVWTMMIALQSRRGLASAFSVVEEARDWIKSIWSLTRNLMS